jgi:hypothetical protein|tara:strand:+ start:209 stop:466 length:258 start_codon:yes stop_codon:yes gene_type:complete
MARRKSLEEIYAEVDREAELDCYDKEDLKLKDQEPFVMIGQSRGGSILIRVGDELGYDVTKSLTFGEALKLIKDLTNALIIKTSK